MASLWLPSLLGTTPGRRLKTQRKRPISLRMEPLEERVVLDAAVLAPGWDHAGTKALLATTGYAPQGALSTVVAADGKVLQFGGPDDRRWIRIARYNADGSPDP